MRKNIETIPRSDGNLVNYSWPGNIRELRNIIERSVILTSEARPFYPKDDLRNPARPLHTHMLTMDDAERRRIDARR